MSVKNSDAVGEAKPEDDALYFEEYHPPFLPLLIVVFPIMPIFWNYAVRVTKSTLAFGFNTSLASNKFDRSRIKSAMPIDHINGLTEWGGWGIRLNLRWETGYIVKNGPGVKLRIDAGEGKADSIYYFSCDDPKKVCEILNSEEETTPENRKAEFQ
jgi:hypothetical protein